MYTQEITVNNVEDAKKHGIHVVPQEMQMLRELTVAENIFLGNPPRNKAGLVDWKTMIRRANEEGITVGKTYHFAASDTERTLYIKAPIATATEPVVWSVTHDIVGIDNIMGGQLVVTLYPNPTDGLFYVNVPTAAEGATVSVTTLSGTTLYSTTLSEGLIAIDLRGQLSAGVYLVVVKSDKQASASKLIVK